MFAVHKMEDGHVDYLGEVFSDTADSVRIQVIDASLFVLGGLWQLTDEIVDMPKSECRMFLSREAAAEACVKANASLHRPCLPMP